MNPRKSFSPQPNASACKPGRQPAALPARASGVAQPMSAAPSRQQPRPAASRPTPEPLRKNAARPSAIQPKAVSAPPVYRPQPVPKVLQMKTAAALAPKPAKAPPVYRPEPQKVLQPKMAAKVPTAPKAPAVYRPQPAPRVLQTKQSQARAAATAQGLHPPHKDRLVVQRHQGLVRPAPQGPVIQRYTLLDKPKGQLSENKNILLTSGKGLYATAQSIENANKQLALAGPHGSMIKLVKTGEAKTTDSVPGKNFFKVTPAINTSAYHARVESLPTSFHKGLKPAEDELSLWADCRRASEAVTGASSGMAFNDRLVKVNGSLLEGYTGGIKRPTDVKNDNTTARLSFQVYAMQIGPFLTKEGLAALQTSTFKELFPELKTVTTKVVAQKWLDKFISEAPTDISVAERLYASLKDTSKDAFHKHTGTNEYANPEIGDAYGAVTEYGIPGFKESGDDWAFHWGGVVMKDGGDNVTLENLSVSKETVRNKSWYFAMYGTTDPSQSFHKRQTGTGHHGNIATTITAVTVGSTENRRLQALRDELNLLKQMEAMMGADQREAMLKVAMNYNELADSIGRAMITEYEVLGSPDRSFTKGDLAKVHVLKKRFIPK